MNQIPYRKCAVYDQDAAEPYCHNKADYVVALDDGEPGETGVLSSFCCEEHKYFNGHRATTPLDVWFIKYVFGGSEQITDWDLS